jgi:hypothetical protein
MEQPDDLTSMITILNKLQKEGYQEDFQITEQGMTIKGKNIFFQPEDLTILRVFRFEGASNPDDMAVVYQIESKDGHKGAYIDAFGTYADQDPIKAAGFLRKVKTIDNH